MDEHKKHIDDLSEIRIMMERASKFISLSGLSGVMAGIFAIIGSCIAYWYLEIFLVSSQSPLIFEDLGFKYGNILFLLLLSVSVFVLAILSGIILTSRNSRKKKLPLWDHTSKKLLINLFIPLSTGAFFIVYLIFNDLYLLIIPASLIFYGLSLINASHFTYNDIKILGYIEIMLGFISLVFNQFALLIWAVGFGIMHIIYGIVMFYKYEK